MKRAVVTGAAGFVGANLARRLLAEGHEVHAIFRPGTDLWRIAEIQKDLHSHPVDLREGDDVYRTVKQTRPDWIFHLATYGAYPSQSELPRMIDTNISGTVNLLEACLRQGFDAFVNTGSSSEYGLKSHSPAETEIPEPNSNYAWTKLAGTVYCQHTARANALKVQTLRLYSIYGPYEEPSRLMPVLITKGLRGQLPPLARSDIARDYVYIDDAIDAYMLAAASEALGGEIYNVGTGTQTTLAEVVEIARQRLSVETHPEWGSMADRSWDTETWVADNRKIRCDLSWAPEIGIEDGFSRFVSWLKSSPEMVELYYQRSK